MTSTNTAINNSTASTVNIFYKAAELIHHSMKVSWNNTLLGFVENSENVFNLRGFLFSIVMLSHLTAS